MPEPKPEFPKGEEITVTKGPNVGLRGRVEGNCPSRQGMVHLVLKGTDGGEISACVPRAFVRYTTPAVESQGEEAEVVARESKWFGHKGRVIHRSYTTGMVSIDGIPAAIHEKHLRFTTPATEAKPEEEKQSPRGSVLLEAKGLIEGDRNNSYGPPTQDFQRTAGILNAMGYKAHGEEGPGTRDIEPHDIALMIAAVKMSRLVWTPGKRDNWTDLAGYAACGYECAVEEGHVKTGN